MYTKFRRVLDQSSAKSKLHTLRLSDKSYKKFEGSFFNGKINDDKGKYSLPDGRTWKDWWMEFPNKEYCRGPWKKLSKVKYSGHCYHHR